MATIATLTTGVFLSEWLLGDVVIYMYVIQNLGELYHCTLVQKVIVQSGI